MLPLDELERAAVAAGCLTVRDEPMNRHTTFRIGGPADLFVTVCSEEGMQLLLRETSRLHVPLFVLGKGSNLLVSDRGVRGCVAVLAGDFNEISLRGETNISCGPAVSRADGAACADGNAQAFRQLGADVHAAVYRQLLRKLLHLLRFQLS